MGALTFDEFDEKKAGAALTFDEFDAPQQDVYDDPIPSLFHVGNIAAGALRGAGSIGATFFRPFESAEENEARRLAMDEALRTLGADPDSNMYLAGKVGGEIAGTAGIPVALGRQALKAAPYIPGMQKLAAALHSGGMTTKAPGFSGPSLPMSMAGKATDYATRVGAGAAAGGTAAALINPEDAEIGAGVGAAIPGIIQPIARPAMSAIGGLSDWVRGRLADVRAGSLMRGAASADDALAAVMAANAAGRQGLTSGQAVAEGVPYAPTYQALQAKIAGFDPQRAAIEAAQEADRLASIRAVTPDLDEAVKARSRVSDVAYGKAFDADAQRLAVLQQEQEFNDAMQALLVRNPAPVKVTPELAALDRFPAIRAAAEAVKKANPDIGNPMTSLRGLHAMKLAIDQQFANPMAATPLQNFTNSALGNTKKELLAAMESISPMYRTARTVYQQASPQVNQAQVLNEIANTLSGPAGKENALPYLRGLKKEGATFLKRADQQKRFDTLEEVLDPNQMGALGRVEADLTRDLSMKSQAASGADSLSDVIKRETPILERMSDKMNVLTRWVTATKGMARIVESDLSDKTKQILIKAMRSGATANDLMRTLPAEDKNKVMMMIARGEFVPVLSKAAPAMIED